MYVVSPVAAMMAASWGVGPEEARTDTKLTRWIERQLAFIEDRFDLDLPKIEVIECPHGRTPEGNKRTMAVGGINGEPVSVLAVSSNVLEKYSPTALHYVVRHEVAHIVDRQERGTSDEDSPAFRAVCERLNAPLSGKVDGIESGRELAHQYAAEAPMEVHEYASKGLYTDGPYD